MASTAAPLLFLLAHFGHKGRGTFNNTDKTDAHTQWLRAPGRARGGGGGGGGGAK